MEFIREQGELQVTFRDYKGSDTITRTIRDQAANTHTCLKNASQQKGGGERGKGAGKNAIMIRTFVAQYRTAPRYFLTLCS